MPYALTNESFSQLLDELKKGDKSALIRLNLILFATHSEPSPRRLRQILLTETQLMQLQSDADLSAFCALHLAPLSLAGKTLSEAEPISYVDYRLTPGVSLPKTDLSKALCGTEAWLKDLAVGYYGPTVTWHEVIQAYQTSGISLDHLNAIVSVIRPGSALHGESQVIHGVGLTANTYIRYIDTEAELVVTEEDLRYAYAQFDAGIESETAAPGKLAKKIPVIRLLDSHAELSLAQFAALLESTPSSSGHHAHLEASLKSNDYSVFKHETLLCAVRVLVEQATIRQQFDPAKFTGDTAAPNYELAKDKAQHLTSIPAGLLLDLIIKVSQKGADLGLFDTAVHIHGVSPEVREYADAFQARYGAEMYSHSAEFNAGLCDLLVGMNASGKLAFSGHIRNDMPTAFTLQQVFFMQTIEAAHEVYRDGRPAAMIYESELGVK